MKYYIVLFLLVSAATPVWAHKVNVFAFAEDKDIYVEVYFPDGKPARDSKIMVTGDKGKTLFEGTADEQGKARFPIPAGDNNLKIVVDAGLGHRSEATIPKDELTVTKKKTAVAMTATAHDHGEGSAAHSHGGQAGHASAAQGDLEAVVQHAVNQAIKPLVRQMSDYEKKAGITEIIGGIGYIFGIFGLFMFLTHKKKGEENTE